MRKREKSGENLINRIDDELIWWLLVKTPSGDHTNGIGKVKKSAPALPDTGRVP